MKKFAIFLLILLVLGSGAYFMTPSLDSVVKSAVHKYGSQVTGTDVSLGGFRFSLLKGEVELRNLAIGNPKNYSQPNIMSVGKIAVKVNLKSVLSDTIVIENVTIEKPEIIYELLSLTQNNLSQLLENIKENTAKADNTKTENATESADAENKNEVAKKSKKVVINHLSVIDGHVTAAASIVEQTASLSVALPNIEMNDIGKSSGKNGINIFEVVSLVLQKIFDTSYSIIVDSKLVDIKSAAEDGLNSLVDGVKEKPELKGLFGW